MADFFKAVNSTVKHWYLPLIIGILFIVFGFYIFTVPLESYIALSAVFAISFVISGVLEIYFSVANRKELEGWGWYLAGGILDLVVGIILWTNPAVSMATLPFFVAFVLLFKSAQGLGFAYDLKNYGVMNWGNIAVWSVLGIILATILLFNPVIAGISIVTFTGVAFILLGIQLISVSFSLKKVKDFPAKLSDGLRKKIADLKAEYETEIKKK